MNLYYESDKTTEIIKATVTIVNKTQIIWSSRIRVSTAWVFGDGEGKMNKFREDNRKPHKVILIFKLCGKSVYSKDVFV